MNVFKRFRVVLPGLAGLVALGLTASAWGEGCTQASGGTAAPILFAKGTQSCSSIQGYVGCSVTKGNGSCNFVDSQGRTTTVTSTIGPNGSLRWSTSSASPEGPAKLYAAGLNGTQQGNACVLFYTHGEIGPQSGIGYISSTGSFTNIQDAFFCTDPNAKVVTKESDIKACTQANGVTLPGANCADLKDGTIISVWTPTYDANGAVTGSSLDQCYCNDGNGVQGSYACNLSGVNDGDSNTLDDCFTSKPLGDPTLIQLFPDATSCSTKLGTTKCSCIDNPFTPTCNECTGAGC